jgi:neutral amino acid transport system ATP-binding protein
MLVGNSLRKEFDGITAVEDCSFQVEEGEFVAVIGPNGAGKSTLFNLLAGYYPPTQGTVEFEGDDVTGLSPTERTWKGMTRTFQHPNSFESLTVMENMIFPVRNREDFSSFNSGKSSSRLAKAREHLDTVGLAQYENQLCEELSYGQMRLLQLAASLMTDPDMLLLDEPTGGINPRLIEDLKELLLKLNEEGLTILIIEHNMSIVMDIVDRILVLHHGELIADGPPEDIQDDEQVLEVYLTGGAE